MLLDLRWFVPLSDTNIHEQFNLNLQEYYAVYLNHCLEDRELNEDEYWELQHLKDLLALDDKTVSKLHMMVRETIYKQSFEEAVADGRLTPEEQTFLDKLQNTLGIPPALAEKISHETRTSFMTSHVASVIAAQQVSPAEETEMHAIASSLNIPLVIGKADCVILDKLKRYWALEHLLLAALSTTIALQKNEQCIMMISNVQWIEIHRVVQSVTYSGYSARFKVAKEFYLKAGSYAPRNYPKEEMTLIDTGTLYFTSKRILFTGRSKNSNLRLEKILQVIPHASGVEIGKDTGRSPFLQFPERVDVFWILLERLLRARSC